MHALLLLQLVIRHILSQNHFTQWRSEAHMAAVVTIVEAQTSVSQSVSQAVNQAENSENSLL